MNNVAARVKTAGPVRGRSCLSLWAEFLLLPEDPRRGHTARGRWPPDRPHRPSFGGYYAARAAAFEKRLSACAIFGALCDGVDLYDTYPPIRNQWRWLTGAKDLDDARARLKAFSLDGVVDKISCPPLVVHGEDDHLVPARHAQRTYDEARTEKRLILYKPGEPGSIHCSYNGFPYTIPALLDWLAERLAVSEPR
jgi:fermentation-respiration switch protein FrsA (DUF1100 family)